MGHLRDKAFPGPACLSKVKDLAGKAGLAHETLIVRGACPGVGAKKWL